MFLCQLFPLDKTKVSRFLGPLEKSFRLRDAIHIIPFELEKDNYKEN